jgi:hypothetical protein
MPDSSLGSQDAIAFGVAADLTYTVFGATNSSPQTTELFASDRADTLMKYVKLGALQAAVLIGVMTFRSASGGGGMRRAFWPAAGGVLTGTMMWLMYAHALKAGDGKPPPAGGRRLWAPSRSRSSGSGTPPACGATAWYAATASPR